MIVHWSVYDEAGQKFAVAKSLHLYRFLVVCQSVNYRNSVSTVTFISEVVCSRHICFPVMSSSKSWTGRRDQKSPITCNCLIIIQLASFYPKRAKQVRIYLPSFLCSIRVAHFVRGNINLHLIFILDMRFWVRRSPLRVTMMQRRHSVGCDTYCTRSNFPLDCSPIARKLLSEGPSVTILAHPGNTKSRLKQTLYLSAIQLPWPEVLTWNTVCIP